MHLRKEILERFESSQSEQVLAEMGYKRVWPPKHVFRLETVLADPWLGLTDGWYDFKHDSSGFLLALCVALGMDREASALRIDDIVTRLTEETDTYQPWLLMESSEAEKATEDKNWLGRWALHAMCKLQLPDEAKGQSLERVIELAGKAIRLHLHDTQGHLGPGYRVDSYLLFHCEDRPSLRLDLEGGVTGVGPKPRNSTC